MGGKESWGAHLHAAKMRARSCNTCWYFNDSAAAQRREYCGINSPRDPSQYQHPWYARALAVSTANPWLYARGLAVSTANPPWYAKGLAVSTTNPLSSSMDELLRASVPSEPKLVRLAVARAPVIVDEHMAANTGSVLYTDSGRGVCNATRLLS